jgi:hypothetical protein
MAQGEGPEFKPQYCKKKKRKKERKPRPHTLLVGTWNGLNVGPLIAKQQLCHLSHSPGLEVGRFLKHLNILTIQPHNCTPGYLSQRGKNLCPLKNLYATVLG